MIRKDRENNAIREVRLVPDVMENAYASVMIQSGMTKVFCTASVNEDTPPYVDETKSGWLTAEYNMLPGSTLTRKRRSIYKPDSRGIEIQRLIARSLRAAIDLTKIPGYSIIIDCDVIQADGGTRTASITGGYTALAMAVEKMLKEGLIKENPLVAKIASISAGIVSGELMLDLNYREDSSADVDFNVIMNDRLRLIEVQGTGEKSDYSKEQLFGIIDLCEKGIKELFVMQDEILKDYIKPL